MDITILVMISLLFLGLLLETREILKQKNRLRRAEEEISRLHRDLEEARHREEYLLRELRGRDREIEVLRKEIEDLKIA
ncbi:MAG TPA: hypothetical protein ENF93_00395, partial [Ignisphaera sp.]|nr:hypothetical protein [Ignisphaera sp.]